MKGEEEKCLSRGMNAYISKPLREKDLIRMIRQFTKDASSSHSHGTHTPQTIDLKYLRDLSAGKSAFVEKMIEQFLRQGKEDLVALEDSFDKGDYTSVKAIAHNLKTSVSFVGLTPKLDLPLSYIEDRVLMEEDGKFMVIAISTVKAICDKALEEAKEYLEEISTPESAA
jgi:YesN/AraC family two-component response regulator